MPSKKKKYNARFPAGRIKKIMQSDEEIGKVAQAVPVIIYYFQNIPRTLELFVESLLAKTLKITNSRNAKTLSPSHMKQCIMAENRFDFLRELVKNIPDISIAEEVSVDSSPETTNEPPDTPYDLSMPSTSNNSNDTCPKKLMPSYETTNLIKNNGVTRTCGTIVSNALNLVIPNSDAPGEARAKLKRQFDALGGKQNQTTQQTESTPPKKIDSGSIEIKANQPMKTRTSSVQQHHQENPQLLPTDLRRLRHQSKSEPGTTSTETISTQINHNKTQIPTPAIPVPVVSIDFCNKPVVKIDYSNLDLHETNYSESISSSTFSPTVETIRQSTGGGVVNLKTDIKTTTTASPESPVINIDLSNIVTSKTFATSLNSSAIGSNCTGICNTTTVTNNTTSFLELDEDYDNI